MVSPGSNRPSTARPGAAPRLSNYRQPDPERGLPAVPGIEAYRGANPSPSRGGSARAREFVETRVKNPDLVVLDVMMPSIDGPTLLKRMRADPDLRHIPVIFMTAKSDPADTARLREASIGVIAKPFDSMASGGQVRAPWSAR